MSIKVRTLPAEGVPDAEDLYNGQFPGLPRLSWTNERFQDVLSWIAEQGVPEPSYSTEENPVATPGVPDGGLHMQKSPVLLEWHGTIQGKTGYFITDVRNLYLMPGYVALALRQAFGMANQDRLIDYPGIELRHPKKPNPIGGVWKEFQNNPPLAALGVIFHPSGEDNLRDYPAWSTFERLNASSTVEKYVKVMYVKTPGIFGTGAAMDYYWQRVNYLD